MALNTTSPYADTTDIYAASGWTVTLPLPYGEKEAPPGGFTGYDAREPTADERTSWAALGPRNIALVLPDGVLGIDVDHYGDKHGGDTLTALESDLGPLPAAPMSTNRDDGTSGIRLFAVPTGRSWRGKAGADIDIIQPVHRYLTAPPSLHPEGRTYRWLGDDGQSIDAPPHRDSLPALPAAWVEHLTRRPLVATPAVTEWLTGLAGGDPSPAVRELLRDFEAAIDADRPAFLRAVEALALAGAGGAHGVPEALAAARAAYIAAKDRVDADADFDRALAGSVTRILSGEVDVYAHPEVLAFEPFPGTDSVARPAGGEEPSTGSMANNLVDFLLARFHIVKSSDGLVYAVPGADTPGPRIATEVKAMGPLVRRAYRDESKAAGKAGVVVRSDALTAALDTVAAYADDEPVDVAVRAAQVADRRVVLDLGTATGDVVDVTPEGWRVHPADEGTPLFRRSAATSPLPTPTAGGDLDVLRGLLGLPDGDPRWRLIRGWLVGSLFADNPRPLLWCVGPQGSGKSTRARMVLSLIEPTGALGREPRQERDDSTAARARFAVSYDNVSTVTAAQSDWLCRLVTGVSDDRRQLYTDGDLRAGVYKRTGVATSIVMPPGLRADALERLSVVAFDRVPDHERRAESALWAAYEAVKPALLAALLDDVAGVLRHLPEVAADGLSLPRMADHALVLAALDRHHGTEGPDGYLAAYVAGVNESLADSALDDPFAAAVIAALRKAGRKTLRGTAEDLLGTVTSHYRDDRLPPWWPASPRAFRSALERSSEALRHAGVTIEHHRTRAARLIVITLDEDGD